MTSLRRAIPSLGALTAFEAAARLGGFTVAATELGVTQAAVSRQIKALEQDLNTPLFLRAHRRVELTPAGQALAQAVTGAFARMTDAIETIRQPQTPGVVTVGATLAFCHFWLLPRLPAFRVAHPAVKLRLIADDGATDLRRDRLDVAVRYGVPPFADGIGREGQRDEVFPVASPALRDRLAPAFVPDDLARLPLISSAWLDPTWLTWRMWAQRAGLGPGIARASDQSSLRFNHYTDTIQAAISGEGVALGWSRLIRDHLADGRLVRLGRISVTPPEGYHVLHPADRSPGPAAQAFLDWIAAELAAGDA